VVRGEKGRKRIIVLDKTIIREYIINATGGGGSGLRFEIASSADPGFAFAGPGDLFYGVVIHLLTLRRVTFIHLHAHRFACFYWAG